MKALILAVVLSALGDAGTTCYGLSRGLYEANPIVRYVAGEPPSCGRVVRFKLAGTAIQLGLLHAVGKRSPKWAKRGMWTITLINTGATISNTIVIGRNE